MEFPQEVIEQIRHYVYVYIDPFTDIPFYIGKGNGNRVFQHLSDESDTEKTNKISEIRSKGKEPKIELIRYCLTENEAALVEAAIIDFIGTSNLTNKIRGSHSRSFGKVSVEDILTTYTAKSAEINHRVLLIIINKMYHSDMTDDELYEATRGIWKIGKKREQVEFAFAVFRGIIREVYRIQCWHQAGTLKYCYRDTHDFMKPDRWEFEGEIAEDIREQYIGKSVRSYLGKGSQNPIRYVNIR